MKSDPRVTDALSKLSGISYADRADDFVRFLADEADDAVRALIISVVDWGDEARENFRRSLDPYGAYRLRLFAMRRTLAARRQGRWGLIDEAMDGFALLATLDDVPWASWVEGALFVARQLGRDLNDIARRFDEMASDVASSRFRAACEAMDRVQNFEQCRMVAVTTDHGTGFVEILVFHDRGRGGYLSTPGSADNVVAFVPTTNLAQLATSLADAFDAGGASRSGPLAQDQLAATLFDLELRGSYLATAGCLSFVVEDLKGGPARSVFVAECVEGTDVESLSRAATKSDQVAVADGARLIVFVQQPRFGDEDGSEDEPGDISYVDDPSDGATVAMAEALVADADLARSILRAGTTATWRTTPITTPSA